MYFFQQALSLLGKTLQGHCILSSAWYIILHEKILPLGLLLLGYSYALFGAIGAEWLAFECLPGLLFRSSAPLKSPYGVQHL